MPYEVKVRQAEAVPTAVVRGRTTFAELPQTIIGLLDQVYAGLAATGARQQGHNVVRYEDHDEEFGVEAGVEVDGAFKAAGGVEPSELPGGRVASVVHIGPYDELHRAHQAVLDFCAAQGHERAGPNWEVYGDWDDDESKLETEVFYLLR